MIRFMATMFLRTLAVLFRAVGWSLRSRDNALTALFLIGFWTLAVGLPMTYLGTLTLPPVVAFLADLPWQEMILAAGSLTVLVWCWVRATRIRSSCVLSVPLAPYWTGTASYLKPDYQTGLGM